MKNRKLGKAGIEVSELGYGAWGIGKQLWKGGDDEQSLEALQRALAGGITFFDTALAYGHGHSERLIGKALGPESPPGVLVATKVPPLNGFWPARGSLDETFPAQHLRQSIEWSLQNLRRDSLDLVQLHVWHPDWLFDRRWWTCLDELRRNGKLRLLGVSANDHEPDSVIEVVRSGLIDTVQVIYNIFDPSAADRLFDVCTENGVGVIARVPFDEGALTGSVTRQTHFPRKDFRNLYFEGSRRREIEKRVEALGGLLGSEVETLAELALRFCLSHPAVSTVIPGMRSSRHVEENLRAAARGPLPPELLQELAAHRWARNFYRRI